VRAGELAVGEKEQWVARDCIVEQLHRLEQIFFCPRTKRNTIGQIFGSKVGIIGNKIRRGRLLDRGFLAGGDPALSWILRFCAISLWSVKASFKSRSVFLGPRERRACIN
jgi:hypothetical protein